MFYQTYWFWLLLKNNILFYRLVVFESHMKTGGEGHHHLFSVRVYEGLNLAPTGCLHNHPLLWALSWGLADSQQGQIPRPNICSLYFLSLS